LIVREVVGCDDFLSLSSAQVIKLISSDKLKVSSEEKVGKLKLIKLLYFSIGKGKIQ